MTFGFILLTAGLAALIAGIKGVSIAEVLRGGGGGDLPLFMRGDIASAPPTDPQAPAGPAGPTGAGGSRALLLSLQEIASSRFNLTITEPVGRDSGDHVANSYHKSGEAFDAASTSAADMKAFAEWVRDNHKNDVTELFYDPVGAWKNGLRIPALGGHKDHVHVAIHWRSTSRSKRGAHKARRR